MESADYGEAIASFKTALAIEPDFFDVLYNSGLAHMKLGDYSSALDRLQAFRASPAYRSLGISEQEEVDRLIQTCRQNSGPKRNPLLF